MRTEQQQLHDAYTKHELGDKVYVNRATPGSNWPMMCQCPCGDWLVYNMNAKAWETLHGHVAADFINTYPELYPILRSWWPDRPWKPDPDIAWDAIEMNLSLGIKAFHDRGPISAKPESHQNPALDKEEIANMLNAMMPIAPMPYEYKHDDDMWKSATISTSLDYNGTTSKPKDPKAAKTSQDLLDIIKGMLP